MRPQVSLIVPVLSDAGHAARLLDQVAAEPAVEVLVVDGGADPGLESLAAGRARVSVLRAPRGRARQMNAGADASRGEWLVFLHADSQMPSGWVDAILHAPPPAVGGWFRFALDDEAWQARLIERGTRWRVRLLRLPYGDQGVFVRRSAFVQLGGFQDLPFLEDVEFVRRLVRAGPVVELALPLVTSARRWRRDGWFRRSTANMAIVALYFAGVSPARLARWYMRERDGSGAT